MKKFPNILSIEKNSLRVFYYIRYFNSIKMYSKYQPVKENTGYIIKKYKTIKTLKTIIYNNIYQCKSGSTISSLCICNGVFDCGKSDTSDEEGCK